MRYQKLTKYITAFEEQDLSGKFENIFAYSYPDIVYQLMEDFYKGNFDVDNYFALYKEYENQAIDTLDSYGVLVLLTSYFEQERFCAGLICAKIIDGTILQLLQRLAKIDELYKIEATDFDEKEFLFYDEIVDRGREYYLQDLVDGIVAKQTKYMSTVHGKTDYAVEIDIVNNEIVDMSCTCPYYMINGENCKHMYAFLAKIEEKGLHTYKTPVICPICHTDKNVIEIVYGLPTAELMKQKEEGKIKLGGCVWIDYHANLYYQWYCKKCKNPLLNNGNIDFPIYYNYLNQMVTVKINKKIGSQDTKYHFVYPLNYGYMGNNQLEAYVLGVYEKIEQFTGTCIAVIHRENKDILVVTSKGKNYTDDEIKLLTEFQEKHFQSKIIR